MPVVSLDYIEVDDRGVAKLIGTRSKVMQIVMDTRNGYTPEEIQAHYPHLTIAQVHAALAYYYDHRAEVDQQIENDIRYAEESRRLNPNRHTRAELERLARERKPKLAQPDRDALAGASPTVVLSDEQKGLLAELYKGVGVAVDELPYTTEMDSLHREFIKRTGLGLPIGDLHRALLNLRKAGKLGNSSLPA